MNRKSPYPQKFREKWKNNVLLKDWIEEVEEKTLVKCKFCKSTMSARLADLSAHAHTKKHLKSSEPFSCNRQNKLPFKAVSNDTKLKSATLEANMSLFVNSHCAISSVDHLSELIKLCFKGNNVADYVQLHRTKCTGILRNIIFPYFKINLKEDIGSSVYSLLLDESTDISVIKQLGVCIIYYSQSKKSIVTTFLSLIELESGTAVSVVKGVKECILMYDLNILNMQGIGCDNASVMVGQHSGVFTLLKKEVQHLVLVRCICHSVQLAVSAAVSNYLPDYLEFLLAETYNWFAHSTSRQLSYKTLFNNLNNGIDPLKIVRVSSTRWLSIEVAVSRVLDQWVGSFKRTFQGSWQRR
ncbi:unnamed protein product [Macrosiphum euphorbiae]|uniref:DUF4371 domain-containing protein n=1 Tax=Macrosiphum euphorbiae TaxID=13131 RepID=A0AAV0XBP4_9HEMI|nr:unnamed protein product [Macrosiphum euphorbiae]